MKAFHQFFSPTSKFLLRFFFCFVYYDISCLLFKLFKKNYQEKCCLCVLYLKKKGICTKYILQENVVVHIRTPICLISFVCLPTYIYYYFLPYSIFSYIVSTANLLAINSSALQPGDGTKQYHFHSKMC